MPMPMPESFLVRSRVFGPAPPPTTLSTRTFLSGSESQWVVRQNKAKDNAWEYVLADDDSTDKSQVSADLADPLADQPLLVDGQMRVIKDPSSWRLRERMKTVAMTLILCLNVGVDPPDVVRIKPYAQRECWIDPSTFPNREVAVREVGRRLKAQFADLSKQTPTQQKNFLCHMGYDPQLNLVHDAVSKTRHAAREKRALFYYNGHGVPRPTNDGEIWVYDDKYTQYMPLSVRDLIVWMVSGARTGADYCCLLSILFYTLLFYLSNPDLSIYLSIYPRHIYRPIYLSIYPIQNYISNSDLSIQSRSINQFRSIDPP
jgi:hypothetical protein